MTRNKNKITYANIVLETYSRMYNKSNPRLDFMDYISTTCNYVKDDTNEKVTTESHLSIKEMHENGYLIDVPFEEHFIKKSEAEKILKDIVKEYKLNKCEESKLRTQIYLGCSPSFTKEDYEC